MAGTHSRSFGSGSSSGHRKAMTPDLIADWNGMVDNRHHHTTTARLNTVLLDSRYRYLAVIFVIVDLYLLSFYIDSAYIGHSDSATSRGHTADQYHNNLPWLLGSLERNINKDQYISRNERSLLAPLDLFFVIPGPRSLYL